MTNNQVTNKEVIDKLRDYFITQPHELVAYACAAFLIDLNRFLNFDELSKEEQEHLLKLTRNNVAQISTFIINGSSTDIIIIKDNFEE